MSKLFKSMTKKTGLPPGTILPAERIAPEETRFSFIDYTEQEVREGEVKMIEECFSFKDTPSVTWINIEGINVDAIKKIDERFGIHPLVVEDVVDSVQRAKMENYENYLFVVLKMIYFSNGGDGIIAEQISLIVGPNYVISFQENKGDIFDPIRERIRTGKGRVRKMGADYLAYALLDMIVDYYFVVLEKIGERIEIVEDELIMEPDPEVPIELHQLKRDMIFLRKQIWPLREVLSAMQRSESKLIKKATAVYLRDVYDHTIQVIDTIESFRDMIAGMHDIYLSSLSNRMNEIMKVLTIFAAIFIPLTFIAGIYGMNFEHMPELKWHDGYFMVLGFMGVVAVTMLAVFKRKGWF